MLKEESLGNILCYFMSEVRVHCFGLASSKDKNKVT